MGKRKAPKVTSVVPGQMSIDDWLNENVTTERGEGNATERTANRKATDTAEVGGSNRGKSKQHC